jgi:serine/threonine protein kinase
VLLDEEFRAHLMGVGLSKFVPWDVMHERTVTAAKYGYLAPEFIYRNELTTKSDVYSFGVLLLEIVSGRRPAQSVDSVGGFQTIFEWATPLVMFSIISLLVANIARKFLVSCRKTKHLLSG